MSSVHRSGANQRAAVGQRLRRGQQPIPQNDMIVYGNGIAYGGTTHPGLGYGMYLQPPQAMGQQLPQSMGQQLPQSMGHQLQLQQQQQQKQRHKSVGAPCLHTAQRAQMRNAVQPGIGSYQSSGAMPGAPRLSHKASKQPQTQQAFGNWTVPTTAPASGAATPTLSRGPYAASIPGQALAPKLSENSTVNQMQMLALMQQQQIQLQQQQLQQQQVHLQAFSGNSYGYNNYHPQPCSDTSGWGGYAMMQPADINKPYTFGWSSSD
ncbi:uncharacterized protein Dana_GF15337 [Drosophila ananassae]|uniref:Uncharacterized protein n=1 Tax=Drosophila ananassae TaxID=7217 RepID=B3MJR5_DROAN|nr:transcription factor SPT20 homolog [Drosophila ananassae]EDV31404.1 uncharacterized protein Dana_GF15337 [Drosophila ananassae]